MTGTDILASADEEEANLFSMQLSFETATLRLSQPFTLATSSRTATPVVFTELTWNGLVGYGEGAMPPYLGESHESVSAFLSRVNLGRFSTPEAIDDIMAWVDGIEAGHGAAKAAVDIALHDLEGKRLGRPWYDIWQLRPDDSPFTSFTIAITDAESARRRARQASGFRMLKLKLGRDTDREIVTAVRSVTSVPLCVDVNQGWTDRAAALDTIHWLAEQGVVFVEQPMACTAPADNAWLTARSPIPVIGDEAIRRLSDVAAASGVYSGINVKLMKAGGLLAARRMIDEARRCGLRVLLGCMTESSCAISAAAHLAPLADWADLDGALLLADDPFSGASLVDGRVVPTGAPGIGAAPRETA